MLARALAALTLATGLAVAVPTLGVAPPARANPTGTELVISEVFSANGSAGFYVDYIELFNPTNVPVDLSGWSIQSQEGVGGPPLMMSAPLSGTVPPYSHFLIGSDNSNGLNTPFPLAPDLPDTQIYPGANGDTSIILADTTAQISATGDLAGVANVVDAVGGGPFAPSWEGTGPAAGFFGPGGLSLDRAACGTDTDANPSDLTQAAGSPTNSSVSVPSCAAPCRGNAVTLVGTGTITGTAGDDVIMGSNQDDFINGNGGHDIICAAGGADFVDTTITGSLTVYGGPGDDSLSGAVTAHHDVLHGGAGDDYLDGSFGNDRIVGGDGADTVLGGGDDDEIYGGGGADDLSGNAGLDTILGGADTDNVYGGDDADEIQGNAGNDFLNGEAADDTLYGGPGDDTLNGDAGNDVLHGGAGTNILNQ